MELPNSCKNRILLDLWEELLIDKILHIFGKLKMNTIMINKEEIIKGSKEIHLQEKIYQNKTEIP